MDRVIPFCIGLVLGTLLALTIEKNQRELEECSDKLEEVAQELFARKCQDREIVCARGLPLLPKDNDRVEF